MVGRVMLKAQAPPPAADRGPRIGNPWIGNPVPLPVPLIPFALSPSKRSSPCSVIKIAVQDTYLFAAWALVRRNENDLAEHAEHAETAEFREEQAEDKAISNPVLSAFSASPRETFPVPTSDLGVLRVLCESVPVFDRGLS